MDWRGDMPTLPSFSQQLQRRLSAQPEATLQGLILRSSSCSLSSTTTQAPRHSLQTLTSKCHLQPNVTICDVSFTAFLLLPAWIVPILLFPVEQRLADVVVKIHPSISCPQVCSACGGLSRQAPFGWR